MSQRLQGRVTLDGSGNGTVRFGPPRIGWAWLIERISVNISGGSDANNPGTSTAAVYVAGVFRDGTETPWTDVSEYSGGSLRMFSSEQLTVVFSDCGAGQEATVIVEAAEDRASGV